jgi:anti-anti-sigma factor
LLDFKNVTFISSSGLIALVVAFRLVRSGGEKVFICSMNEQVKMLFELTGVEQVFESFANLEEFNNTVLMKT